MAKYKWYIIIGAVIITVAVVWLLTRNNQRDDLILDSALPSPTPTVSTVIDTPLGTTEPISGNELVGTLQVSNNLTRGNLMLVTSLAGRDTIIYLTSSRDFSALLGKTVRVNYSGTPDAFILGNIVAE